MKSTFFAKNVLKTAMVIVLNYQLRPVISANFRLFWILSIAVAKILVPLASLTIEYPIGVQLAPQVALLVLVQVIYSALNAKIRPGSFQTRENVLLAAH